MPKKHILNSKPKDIFDLIGGLKKWAAKGKNIEQIMAIEKKAIRNRWADRAKKWTSQKRTSTN